MKRDSNVGSDRAGNPHPGFLERGGLWVAGQMLLLLVIFPGGLVWSQGWHSTAITVLGIVLLFFAAVSGIAGTVSLGRNLTPFPQPSPSGQLIQDRIYGLMRHPLYTAVFCASLGWAFVFASWPALVATACLGPFFDAKARVEEQALRRKFPDYESYQQRVKRFIPWIY